ncbi:hypothetical protein Patl1_02266 [Pistacia atlantica]|uniref:Uncharacterized protein n=1 Tax=Pistacia atlantica TaxID=434234 RepID=A0ACC1C4A7_9ROSI|nr:hypothetical protein Patl1_02266 [Pistacia atlantica]
MLMNWPVCLFRRKQGWKN